MSCAGGGAAECGCAENTVKYRSGGLFFKNPKLQSTTEHVRKSLQKRDRNKHQKQQKKEIRRQSKNHRKLAQNGTPELPGTLPESLRTRFFASGSPSKKTSIFDTPKNQPKIDLERPRNRKRRLGRPSGQRPTECADRKSEALRPERLVKILYMIYITPAPRWGTAN